MVSASIILLPLYIYPFPLSSWSTLTTSLTQNPRLNVLAIVNPASGPGPAPYPDGNYTSAIASLNSHSNLRTLCYIHTSYAKRAIADVKTEIDTCAGWATYPGADIHMGGIFFDEAPDNYNSQTGTYMSTVSSYARTKLGAGRNTIVFNPGTSANRQFFPLADYINVFEDSFRDYSQSVMNSIPQSQRAKSTFIIYGYTGNSKAQTKLVATLKNAGLGGLFLSTQSVYSAWSSLWVDFCSAMAS